MEEVFPGLDVGVAAKDPHPSGHPEGTRPCAQGEGLRLRGVVPKTVRIIQIPFRFTSVSGLGCALRSLFEEATGDSRCRRFVGGG